MRLAILDSGHGFWAKVLFAITRLVSRQPVADAIRLNHCVRVDRRLLVGH